MNKVCFFIKFWARIGSRSEIRRGFLESKNGGINIFKRFNYLKNILHGNFFNLQIKDTSNLPCKFNEQEFIIIATSLRIRNNDDVQKNLWSFLWINYPPISLLPFVRRKRKQENVEENVEKLNFHYIFIFSKNFLKFNQLLFQSEKFYFRESLIFKSKERNIWHQSLARKSQSLQFPKGKKITINNK